ncbi:MAG: transposase [Ignavibacteriae bacterium]|nr:transposase [Ignavibacteriota bacterium]
MKNAEIHLSEIGKIVGQDWRAIPSHYSNVSLDAFQVMPNHLHGIITINDRVSRDMTPSCPTMNKCERRFGQPISGSVSSIIGAYKSGVTIKSRNTGFSGKSIWQSRFYDHIIRSDFDLYMIQQYIELNPLIWEYDIDNPEAKSISFAEFEELLVKKFGITGQALYMVLDSKKMSRVRVI